ncbi:MAG TPA: GNAT family N-acetyltransferase [Gemmataceae bacterium]|nr:GNAT family N-acetyltransferase [Gemmataceae bacterium]
MKIRLETPRLILREFTEADAESLFELDSDPEVMRYLGPYQLGDVEAYRSRIQTVNIPYYAEHPGYGVYAVVEKAGGAFLGWILLRPGLAYRFAAEAGFRAEDVELGYRLRRSAWGKGYASEGSRGLVHDAFTRLGTACVVAVALVGNRASTRVMEKVGLRCVEEFRLPGFEEPAVKYALEKNDYDPQRGCGR